MAVTRLWQSSMELRDLNPFDEIFGTDVTASNTVAKTGTYSLRTNGAGSNQFAMKYITATRQIRVGAFVYFPRSAIDNDGDIIAARSVTPTKLVTVRRYPNTSKGVLEVGGVDIQTIAGLFPPEQWIHIGLDIKINNAAGWVKVYKDGVEVLSATGNTGNADIVEVDFGFIVAPNTGNHYQYYDSMYIDDLTGEGAAAVVPILYFNFVALDGNGNYNGNWAGSDGDSVNNYQLIDEVPPVTTDYIQVAVTNTKESFTTANYTLGTNETPEAVIPLALVERGDTTEQIAIGTRYSGTDVVGSNQTPTLGYKILLERQTTKPGGGAWDQTALNGFEVEIESKGTY